MLDFPPSKVSLKLTSIWVRFCDYVGVMISMQEGKVLPSMLLRKLSTYSRKNRLYQAFHALGTVVRTAFLLTFISDVKLREVIHRSTNKVEQYLFGLLLICVVVMSQGLMVICGGEWLEGLVMGILYQVCKMWVKVSH